MIYLAAALYAEAAPFIHNLNLKKRETHTRFQVFASDTHLLIITGTGCLNAAIADTWLCSHYPPDPERDVFAQIGTCGAINGQAQGTDTPPAAIGSLYLCHKLTDAATGHSRYPDMIYRSEFHEASLVTYATVQTGSGQTGIEPGPDIVSLADMEGYGGYQAASVFFPPHRIFTWKVVSDHGDAALTPARVTELMEPHAQRILDWLAEVPARGTAETDDPTTPEQYVTTLSETYGYSATQRQQLFQLLHYARLTDHDINTLLAELPDPETIHPAQKKKEGKRILHELEQRIIP